MRRILLAGAFGQRNPGDDALRDAFTRALPGREVVATAGRTDLPAVVRRIRDADAVVVGGGTVFKELRPSSRRPPLDLLSRALALAGAAKATGMPFAMVGVGVGRLTSKRAQVLARHLVRQADLLVLRDDESADALSAIGAPMPIRVGADAAWTLLDGVPDGGYHPAGPVRVALSHEAGDDDLPRRIACALVPVLATGTPVQLQPWQVGGPVAADDLDLARAVRDDLGASSEIVLPPESLVDAADGMRGCSAVLAMRFHAIPAACVAGVPVVAYDHETKLRGLAGRLGIPALGPEATPTALGDALVAAAASGPVVRPAVLRGQIAAAEEGFRLLRLLLDGGRTFADAATIGELPLRPEEWAP